jgi:anti-sigma factor RsiW
MIPNGPERHVRTADLLRFVDGEGSAAFRERVTAHLAGCADCTAASEQLRANTASVLGRLDVLDEVAAADKLPATFAELAQRGRRRPAAARVVGWRRAAGIILFVGVGAAVARPAAAWLERLLDKDQASPTVTAAQPASETPAAAPVDTTSAAYSFTPASNELRIDFAAAEPDAELLVRALDESAASFALQSTASLPPVLILPNGVRITNGANHGTRYELALPRNVDVLIVSIAGGAVQRIAAGSLPARIRLNEGR